VSVFFYRNYFAPNNCCLVSRAPISDQYQIQLPEICEKQELDYGLTSALNFRNFLSR
jgi:hypothetical protein